MLLAVLLDGVMTSYVSDLNCFGMLKVLEYREPGVQFVSMRQIQKLVAKTWRFWHGRSLPSSTFFSYVFYLLDKGGKANVSRYVRIVEMIVFFLPPAFANIRSTESASVAINSINKLTGSITIIHVL